MANIAALPRAAVEPTAGELAAQIASLNSIVADMRTALAARLAELEARLPPKRLELPRGWPCVKEASHLAGVSEAKIYRAISDGVVFALKIGNATVIHPDDIAKLRIRLSHAARASC